MFITSTNSYPPADGSRPTYLINPNQITWVREFEPIGDCPAHTEVFITGSSNPFCVLETPDEISELAHRLASDCEYRAIENALDKKTSTLLDFDPFELEDKP